jgi:hypothetical protein
VKNFRIEMERHGPGTEMQSAQKSMRESEVTFGEAPVSPRLRTGHEPDFELPPPFSEMLVHAPELE